MNIQPLEKLSRSDGNVLDVHSIFQTIQGEGPLAGEPAVFIRLAGCNLQCPRCDTDYTKGRSEMSTLQILDAVAELMQRKNHTITTIVITGGEPFRQNISPLCNELLNRQLTVQIETNGTLPPPPGFPDDALVVCSPKTSHIHKRLVPHLSALKYVVKAGDVSELDGLPMHALGNTCEDTGVARPPEHNIVPVYVQPQDDTAHDVLGETRNRENMATAVNSCLDHGHILCIQMHKYAAIE